MRFYFYDAGRFIHYYNWSPLLVGIMDDSEYLCAENGAYAYDATTGVLDCDILGSYKLVMVDDDNMWFVMDYDKEGFDILHFEAVSPAVLKEWNENYNDLNKVKDLLKD